MAEETFFPPGLEIFRPVGVAVDAGQSAHAFAVHLPVLMALGAELFRRQEMVKTALVGFYFSVALSAFDLLHVHMFRMEQRFIDRLGLALGMAMIAVFLAHDDFIFMPLGHLCGPVQDKADEKLVLLGYREMVTVMAVKRFVLALRPGVIGRLHQVTAYAEFRIVLSEIIKLVGYKTAAAHNDE